MKLRNVHASTITFINLSELRGSLDGNLAGIAGDALYGGRIDRCGWFPKVWSEQLYILDGVDFKETYLRNLLLNISGNDFELIFNFNDKAPSSSLVSSDPF